MHPSNESRKNRICFYFSELKLRVVSLNEIYCKRKEWLRARISLILLIKVNEYLLRSDNDWLLFHCFACRMEISNVHDIIN